VSDSIPHKPHYKLGEVCEIADTQPYVLRFWESEFPQLRPRKSRSGHPIYTRDDIDLVLRIKRLLHEQEYTLADARTRLDEELQSGTPVDAPAPPPPRPQPPAEPPADEGMETELEATRRRLAEMRDRYDAACEEIRRLKDEIGASGTVLDERDALRREAEALRERVADLERGQRDVDRSRGVQREHDQERKQLRARVDELAGTLEETAAERDRARERAEAAEADVDRLNAELADRNAALRVERATLAGRLESALAAFRELHGGGPGNDRPVS